ncbi:MULTISPECIES: helix-turn-helix domain-containing protein [unclassified Psychrobacter]|uniref:helix-turn-helix domain-containing protein n=1 Tax=unclassified Psychrobacter TaxID=196806 RepID=UPI0018F71596|nr:MULTISPECIES: helix-turn-helix domain-containing protein [unclassified Psychrobacter]
MTDIYTTPEIISEMKNILGITHDNELAEYLEVGKQSVYQYKQKVNPDIQQKIISELLTLIKENNSI